MSGQWPPEWDDPEEEVPQGADQPDAAAEARLSEVSAYLASVPAPAMPEAVEARISAALATESAARADTHGSPGPGEPGPRTLGAPPPRARGRRGRRRGRRRWGSRSRPLLAVGALFVCLILAGLGVTLSRGGGPATSNSAAVGSAVAPSAASSAAGAAPEPATGNGSTSFSVTVSGTKYQQAILAGQVRANLAANKGQGSFGVGVPAAGATVPAASASAASTAVMPSSALRGCVLQLTSGKAPRLVDRATYQGEPAYVIASSSRVWVVGLGCTADKTELITSVPLAG
jgi:hypothetical protein